MTQKSVYDTVTSFPSVIGHLEVFVGVGRRNSNFICNFCGVKLLICYFISSDIC